MMTSTLTSSRAETVECVQGGLEQVKSNQILIPDTGNYPKYELDKEKFERSFSASYNDCW
jgi:hypothetical protein